jgi:hypothetical protein
VGVAERTCDGGMLPDQIGVFASISIGCDATAWRTGERGKSKRHLSNWTFKFRAQ